VKHRTLVEAFPLEVLRRLGGERPPVLIDVKGFLASDPPSEWGEGRYWRL
jgi:hypothetical protein